MAYESIIWREVKPSRSSVCNMLKGRVGGKCLMCLGHGEQLSIIRTLDVAE